MSRLHHAMPSVGPRFIWRTFWRKAREAQARAQARRGVSMSPAPELSALHAMGDVAAAAAAAVSCLRERWERGWPQLDLVLWRAWNLAGRPSGSWLEFKGDRRARSVAMQRLATAVRLGERGPGGRKIP